MGIGSEYHFNKWFEAEVEKLKAKGQPTEPLFVHKDLLKQVYAAGFDKGWEEGSAPSWCLGDLDDEDF